MTDDAPALRASFGHDLLTEWIPDALGAADVLRDLARGRVPPPAALDVGWLRVPLSRRTEAVPVVPVAVRAHLHRTVERALRGYEPAAEVFSYRALTWDYRTAFGARGARMRALAERGDLPLVLSLDVHRFGRSLPLPTLLDATWMTEELGTLLGRLTAEAGHCLLSSHHWANRLGSAALAPVDAVLGRLVPGRWLRWADDWHVFVRDADEADRVRAAVRDGLATLGLTLSADKSGLRPAATVLAGPARDVAGEPARVWRAGVAGGDLRALRYALPRLAPDARISAEVPSVVRRWPALLPRAVRYLDGAARSAHGRAVVAELLGGAERDPFAAARLLALTGRHAELAALVPGAVLAMAGDDGSPAALRELATRVAVVDRRAHLAPEPTPRLRAWVADGGHAGASQPSVATLL
ncbi:hypothetical protein OYE22_15105 [Streptomyces sp. 71268]|uniref:hypothetical protein n=1 Tax=Streptomyces sp. 71268 TaxID=3002640 RepID=UPI0023F9B738|nr:hypothetical protein [Streptomyces sp. 71268]WEV26376.1 hypothetical protein OYE22_15105 [Streptomyces sp. 71268]